MKKLISAAAICALAGAAVNAETGYEYPPEFADLFDQFRVITPEEAQIYLALDGDDPWHTLAGGVVLEPLLIKCVNGIPAYYLVISYNGRDSNVRGEMEDVIKMMNDGDGFNAGEVDKKLKALEPAWGDFRYLGMPAWTFGGGPNYSRAYVPELFAEFSKYLASLREVSRAGGTPQLRIYATYTAITAPVFGVDVGRRGAEYYIGDPDTGGVAKADVNGLNKTFHERTASIRDEVEENAEAFFEKAKRWDMLKEREGELERKGDYLKVREHATTAEDDS